MDPLSGILGSEGSAPFFSIAVMRLLRKPRNGTAPCLGLCRSRNVDFLQHARRIATRPNCRHCYVVTKLSRAPAEWFCRGIRHAQRDDHALVPVAFEIGLVSGAVCAGVPARGFVRPRASRALRAAFGSRERARRRAAIGRPRYGFQTSRSRTPGGRPLPDLHADPSRRRIGARRDAVVAAACRFRPDAARSRGRL
jgi:hypothetical protein